MSSASCGRVSEDFERISAVLIKEVWFFVCMRVSVLMPVYNAEEFLSEAITSVLNQSFSDFELVIVDDCSTDSSLSVIESFAQEDSRIKVVSTKTNSGVTVALNTGLAACSGEFVARMDADDVCVVDRLKKQVAAMKSCDIVGSWITVIDSSGKELFVRTYSNDVASVINKECPLAHPTVMFRRLLVDKYDSSFSTSQDYELWFRLFSNGARFTVLQESLLKYRVHDGSVKSGKIKTIIRNTLAIKKKARREYGVRFGFSDWMRVFVERVALLFPGKIILWVFMRKIGGSK